LRYRLLGHVTASDGPLGGPKPRTVLAALLLHANQVVPDRRLCELVWGDHPPATVRSQLQIYVSGLRKLLGPDTIRRQGTGYLIQVHPGELDLDVFTDLVEQGRFREAVALWPGPALGGCTESLVDDARLDERRLAALEMVFEAELAQGNAAGQVGELRRLVAENPYRERLAEQLMLALHGSGRTSEALGVYAATRHRLATDFGVEPGDRLRDLHRRLLGGGPPTSTPVPAQLPHTLETFAGRRAELAALDADLADWTGESVRIRVLSGEAGVGKTALAVHWAHRVRRQFPDGQLYADLARWDTATALAALLRSLDIAYVPDLADERAALFRSALADRKCLLLLDNAADADPAAAAGQIGAGAGDQPGAAHRSGGPRWRTGDGATSARVGWTRRCRKAAGARSRCPDRRRSAAPRSTPPSTGPGGRSGTRRGNRVATRCRRAGRRAGTRWR
jgi:DNA-binding SARP family transcriptional activator